MAVHGSDSSRSQPNVYKALVDPAAVAFVIDFDTTVQELLFVIEGCAAYELANERLSAFWVIHVDFCPSAQSPFALDIARRADTRGRSGSCHRVGGPSANCIVFYHLVARAMQDGGTAIQALGRS